MYKNNYDFFVEFITHRVALSSTLNVCTLNTCLVCSTILFKTNNLSIVFYNDKYNI